jgi:hypothetical protein
MMGAVAAFLFNSFAVSDSCLTSTFSAFEPAQLNGFFTLAIIEACLLYSC